jgi:muramidase (phage lysozyme)
LNANQLAFMATISHTEGTDRAEDPFRVCFARRHVIVDLNFHPAERRGPFNVQEWKGESLDFLGAQYEGQVSTAAGRYQMRLKTWLGCKKVLSLEAFTGDAQNDACILLLKQRGALALVNAGLIQEAVIACKDEWASFPGGHSHQPQHDFAFIADFYRNSGGALA